MAKIGKCLLCHTTKPLQKKSHIIPEFMYERLFDKHHKLFKFRPAEYLAGNRKVIRQASGEYESNILCRECDNDVIGLYETYAKEVVRLAHSRLILPESSTDDMTTGGVRFRRCNGVDYRKFKIFLLSILWRASISTREVFQPIKLDEPHEEKIRSMIFSGEPGSEREYPILMISYFGEDSMRGDLIGEPGLNTRYEQLRFIFPTVGVTYIFHLSEDAIPQPFRAFTLRDIGQIKLLYTPPGTAWDLLMTYAGANRT